MLNLNAINIYRLGHFFYKNNIIILAKCMNCLNLYIHNSYIPSSCEIGKDTQIAYGGIAVVIHDRVRIGKHCTIGTCVTIGGNMGSIGVPIIEDNVFIGPGSKILGDIRIGHDSIVGANAVVIRDVKPYSVVAGQPARLIHKIDKDNYEKKYKHCYGPRRYLE
jgi:serine O-acetyltransferase